MCFFSIGEAARTLGRGGFQWPCYTAHHRTTVFTIQELFVASGMRRLAACYQHDEVYKSYTSRVYLVAPCFLPHQSPGRAALSHQVGNLLARLILWSVRQAETSHVSVTWFDSVPRSEADC